jgi:HlyD family secretion protein
MPVPNRKTIVRALLIFAIAGGLTFYFLKGRSGTGPDVARVSGNIEVTDAELGFKIPGRVEKRLVSEGEWVRTGQLAATLETRELTQEVALRKAELWAAKAALAELEAGSRPEEVRQAEASTRKAQAWLEELVAGSRPEEVAAQEAAMRSAKAEAERLQAESDRQRRLYREGFVSAQEYDAARTAYEMARERFGETEERLKLVREGPRKEQIEQARAALVEAKERFALIKNGPRPETIEQSRARLEQMKQALALAETRLGYATLISPLTGIVLSEHVEAGEYVAAGTPIVTVGDLENVWVRAYINETDLGRVKVGQRARVSTDTYPGKVYEGRVSFIASQAEFTPKNVQTEKERVKLVYRIKVDIKNVDMELKPGMPADVEIPLNRAEARH